MITQAELERQTADFGEAKAYKMMAGNEAAGRAMNNPYAAAVIRRYVLPLAEVINTALTEKKAGRRAAHVALLSPLDPEVIAYLAVRGALQSLLRRDSEAPATAIGREIGKAVHHELLLEQFSAESPELFHTLVYDLEKRRSKAEQHRIRVFMDQAKKNGIDLLQWGPNNQVQVGTYLLESLVALGMLELRLVTQGVTTTYMASLSEESLGLIGEIKEHVALTTPYFLPCIEPPKDWVAYNDGGYHTPEMRRLQPYAVKVRHSRTVLSRADLTVPLAAINKLQQVKWRINKPLLAALIETVKHFDTEETVSLKDAPEPDRPDWLLPDLKKEDMTEVQLAEFKDWRRAKAEWFTQKKLRMTKWGRLNTATSIATRFKDFDALYFVYFADFRGRLYAQTTGVSPQGSDMQKSLLEFSVGKPLRTKAAVDWFKINIANKWGYDKASLQDRVRWVDERRELLHAMGTDPINNRDWIEADKPFQFLATCIEYAGWLADPEHYLSRQPVGMDGSCNGLQNFSAMLRDEIGGRATNLVPSPLPNDIYQMVADVAAKRLQAWKAQQPHPNTDEERELYARNASYAERWLAHGINRKLVKRSVMTLPYGSTRYSCGEFIAADYLKAGYVPEFDKAEYGRAARFLSSPVWDSIGDVVVKAREAMEWLQMQARMHIKSGASTISWKTPTGFVVVQDYREQIEHRIRTNLAGQARIRLFTEGPKPDINRHKNGIAPNFIHSYDASHLALVTVKAAQEGLDLAMIHDDYGTHAADAARLYEIIRSEFIAMYEQFDPLDEFPAYPDSPPPPTKGNLDLKEVANSPYFFS